MTESVTPVPPAPTGTGITEAQIPTENPAVRTVKAALAAHGVYASTTYGQSMEPLFRTHRDLVFLSPPDGPFRRFDVILYPGHHENCLLHRIQCCTCHRRKGSVKCAKDNSYQYHTCPEIYHTSFGPFA